MTAIAVTAVVFSVLALLISAVAFIMAYGAANLNRQCMQAIVDVDNRLQSAEAVLQGMMGRN